MAYCILKRYRTERSAFDIFCALKDRANCFFLDSGINGSMHLRGSIYEHGQAHGRYSFVGADPFCTLEADGPRALVRLGSILERYKIPAGARLPFTGGAVGFLSYELGAGLEEKISAGIRKAPGIPGCYFGFYNSVVIIDHFEKSVYISCLGFPEKRYSAARRLAEANLKKITALLDKAGPCSKKPGLKAAALKSNFKKAGYLAAVRKAKYHIRRGDIYQVNLSQQFEARTRAGAFGIYCRLRDACPTRFGAYFDACHSQVLSASPERFLKLENGIVSTRPMKGTRPRSSKKTEDNRLKNKLLSAAKDKAELMMIVDLERNDLGRACVYDSVKVERLRQLEEYATVFQTTATISGRLGRGKDRIDLLRACFPGGSITGCPKIRAMEIIRDLEPGPRGIYTGALGYLGFNGNMDLNILIRTILKRKNKVYFSVGGGIVADSVPEEEYKETLVKAKAIFKALNLE